MRQAVFYYALIIYLAIPALIAHMFSKSIQSFAADGSLMFMIHLLKCGSSLFPRGFNKNNKPALVSNSLTTSLEEHAITLAPGGITRILP